MKTGKDMPETIKYYLNVIKEKGEKNIWKNNYFGEFWTNKNSLNKA